MTERILTQAQASEMGFLRRVHGVTQRRTEIRRRPGQEQGRLGVNVGYCTEEQCVLGENVLY